MGGTPPAREMGLYSSGLSILKKKGFPRIRLPLGGLQRPGQEEEQEDRPSRDPIRRHRLELKPMVSDNHVPSGTRRNNVKTPRNAIACDIIISVAACD